jgi:phosphoglucomutase
VKPQAQSQFQRWLNHPQVSQADQALLRQYSESEINDAFFKNIEFGTAGMRGILGPGPNRINTFTIQKATVAFGQYLQEVFPHRLHDGVVIAHDNRHGAKEFTQLTANILNQMGIKTFVFSELVPTPLLSYAVRHLHAIGGVMLTASHNPKEYNGYKVYDHEGCQLVPAKIEKLVHYLAILPNELEVVIPQSSTPGKRETVDGEVEVSYLTQIKQLQLQPRLNKDNFPIVFSPQHGASYRILPNLFQALGYDIHVVKSQAFPDPDFSGTASPNPEEKVAYDEAIRLAQTINAPLVMVADPDADRVGLAYRGVDQAYHLLNGNESAALLLDYVLSQKQKQQILPVHGVVYDTIVSSPLARTIAKHYGMKVETFLTGFKFIGDRIAFYQQHAGPQFVFGYEESYGCLLGDFVRDKDAIQALTMYAEMTLHYALQGMTLGDALAKLYRQYGYILDQQFSLQLQGEQGQTLLTNIMHAIRRTPFKPLGTFKVIQFDDYFAQLSKTAQGQHTEIALPKADVVRLILTDGSTIIIRPSGTEPKCKFYYSIKGENKTICQEKLNQMKAAFTKTYLPL